jgi:hypothetical protein
MPLTPKVKEKHWGNVEGGNHLNGTVVWQQYGQPCNRHPVHGPGVVHVEALGGIHTGVQSWTMMGREGEGEGGGEYKGECLLLNYRNNDSKYNNKKDGKGLHGGAEDGG